MIVEYRMLEIAREVHLSRMAVRERVMKMTEEDNRKFTLQLNSSKVGLNTSVFLKISATPSEIDYVAMNFVGILI